MTFEEFKKAAKKLSEDRYVWAFVVSEPTLIRVLSSGARFRDELGLTGAAIYAWGDVPECECVAFYTAQAFIRYCALRRSGEGHVTALRMMRVELSPEVMAAAEINARLNLN